MSKPVPRFWWDFDGSSLEVIVQSDYPGGECLARFKSEGVLSQDAMIAQAEALIADYKAGRKTPNFSKSSGQKSSTIARPRSS